MGSAARFLALLAAGVMIMVVYVRSGESLVVLVLSLLTFVVGLAAWIRQPWAVQGGEANGGVAIIDQRWDENWRCGHDVTWDDQGIRAVAVGDRLPALTLWSRIDRITIGRYRASADDRGPQRRRGIHLELYRPNRDGRPPASGQQDDIWLCVGPDQDLERVAAGLTSAWRQAASGRQPRAQRPGGRDPNRPTGR